MPTLKKGSKEAKDYMAYIRSLKKTIKPKKVGAIKIVEKGETKFTKPSATYEYTRTKKGTFKGMKKIGDLSDRPPLTEKPNNRIFRFDNSRGAWIWKYFKDYGYISVAQINDKTRTIRPTHGYYYPSPTAKLVLQYAKKNGYNFMQDIHIPGGTGPTKYKYIYKIGATKSSSKHYDTKSHNVNIRVVSGVLSKDEIKFLETEHKKSKGYKYRAKILYGQPIVLKETDKGTPVQKWIVDDYEKATYLAKELNKKHKIGNIKTKIL